MVDVCLRATSPSARLEIALGFTTRVVQKAQQAHDLAPTSLVALGRLLTATGLVAVTAKRPGTTSIQVLSKGRIRQLLVDANEEGHLRGYPKVADLSFPITASERSSGRREVAPGVLPGQLSVVRRDDTGAYAQSSVDLASGEIDGDVEYFLQRSDQVPTVLTAEVVVDGSRVELGVGVMVQAMPDGDRVRLEEIRATVAGGGLARLVQATPDPQQLLAVLQPDAEIVEAPLIFQWRCRCSQERVVRSLQLLGPVDLAEMIESGQPTEVTCDFCATTYSVDVPQIQAVFETIATAKG